MSFLLPGPTVRLGMTTILMCVDVQEVYEAEKEKVLLGERLVLTTLGFDLNIHHPYKPLVAAIKKFQVAANTLAQVAWNFVNDG
jgi:cyclin T